MYDDGSVPPMSPEDFAALAAFAGPLYQQSRTIESYSADGHRDDGSINIKHGLEKAKHLAQSTVLRQQGTMYVPPADPQFLASEPYATPEQLIPDYPPVQHFPQPGVVINTVPQRDNNQLEFSFEKKEQQVTNDLLKEISGKLSKLLKILEKEEVDKTERQDKLPKQAPTPKHVNPKQITT